jgi:hypothetical protein
VVGVGGKINEGRGVSLVALFIGLVESPACTLLSESLEQLIFWGMY